MHLFYKEKSGKENYLMNCISVSKKDHIFPALLKSWMCCWVNHRCRRSRALYANFEFEQSLFGFSLLLSTWNAFVFEAKISPSLSELSMAHPRNYYAWSADSAGLMEPRNECFFIIFEDFTMASIGWFWEPMDPKSIFDQKIKLYQSFYRGLASFSHIRRIFNFSNSKRLRLFYEQEVRVWASKNIKIMAFSSYQWVVLHKACSARNFDEKA